MLSSALILFLAFLSQPHKAAARAGRRLRHWAISCSEGRPSRAVPLPSLSSASVTSPRPGSGSSSPASRLFTLAQRQMGHVVLLGCQASESAAVAWGWGGAFLLAESGCPLAQDPRLQDAVPRALSHQE